MFFWTSAFTACQIMNQTIYILSIFELNFHIASDLNQDSYSASDSDEKTVFRKSNFVGVLALKDSFSWSIYTVKMSKLAFLCILGKVVPEKIVFKKKEFCIKIFETNQLLNQFLYNASYFESRISNALDLETIFQNSKIFGSNTLEHVRYREK